MNGDVEQEHVFEPLLVTRGNEPVVVSVAVGSATVLQFAFREIRVVSRVRMQLVGIPRDSDSDRAIVNVGHTKQWPTIEDIARYVAGDGTDSMRVALADGIRAGRWSES